MNIVCAQTVLFGKEIFSNCGTVNIVPEHEISAHHLRNADALIIRSKTRVDKKLLEASPVSFVGTATAGIDHVDVDYLQKRHITFAHAAGANANSVAEYIITALLTLSEKFAIDLSEKTLGVIGVGHVGTRVVELAQQCGLTILQNDPPRALQEENPLLLPLDVVLQNSDIVTLHVPFTTVGEFATQHLVDHHFLTKLKPHCILINTSRGEVIEEIALKDKLSTHALKGVVLDVFENEPCPDVDLIQQATIATAHIAGYSVDGLVGGSLKVYEHLCQFMQKKPELTLQDVCPLLKNRLVDPVVNKSGKHELAQLIRQVYNIEADHLQLISIQDKPESMRPQHFKNLRNNYKQRFEFHHYKISSKIDPKTAALLHGLGFQ